jgi:hypothetical protein
MHALRPALYAGQKMGCKQEAGGKAAYGADSGMIR